MEKILKFKAKDGLIFDSEDKCLDYEKIVDLVELSLRNLDDSEEYNKDCSFSNGSGFLQHSEKLVIQLEKDLIDICNKYFNPKEPFERFNHYVGRLIDDSNTKCLNKMSYKLMCIDKLNREWGQPYFANNPDKGIQKCLND